MIYGLLRYVSSFKNYRSPVLQKCVILEGKLGALTRASEAKFRAEPHVPTQRLVFSVTVYAVSFLLPPERGWKNQQAVLCESVGKERKNGHCWFMWVHLVSRALRSVTMDCFRSCGHVQKFQSDMKIMESGETTYYSGFDKCGQYGQGMEALVYNDW